MSPSECSLEKEFCFCSTNDSSATTRNMFERFSRTLLKFYQYLLFDHFGLAGRMIKHKATYDYM